MTTIGVVVSCLMGSKSCFAFAVAPLGDASLSSRLPKDRCVVLAVRRELRADGKKNPGFEQ